MLCDPFGCSNTSNVTLCYNLGTEMLDLQNQNEEHEGFHWRNAHSGKTDDNDDGGQAAHYAKCPPSRKVPEHLGLPRQNKGADGGVHRHGARNVLNKGAMAQRCLGEGPKPRVSRRPNIGQPGDEPQEVPGPEPDTDDGSTSPSESSAASTGGGQGIRTGGR